MGFVEDEQKSFAEGMKAESAIFAKRSRNSRKIIWVLLVLFLAGSLFVIKDYLGTRNTDDIFTNDQEVKRKIIEKWMRVGFIIEFDLPSSTCTFNEDRWKAYSQEEKTGVTRLLDSYYANVVGAEYSGLTVKGSNTGSILATFGASGVVLP